MSGELTRLFSGGNNNLNNPYSMEYAEYQDYLNTNGSNAAGKVDLGLGSNVGGGSSQGFMDSIGGVKGIGTGLSALSSLGGYFNAKESNALTKDSLNFNKGMANKEYAMAKDAYDRQVKRASNVGDQMNAGKVLT